MDPLFADAFDVDAARAFNFFATALGDLVEADGPGAAGRDEFLYVSSILAHFALVEAGDTRHLPIPGTLREIHDLFVTDPATWGDAALMETAAAQTLMLTGYFAAAMRRRHHLGTYVDWGRAFYARAASGTTGRKQELLRAMSRRFPVWRGHLEHLHTHLREQPLVLRLPGRPGA
jgi:hypothetical protein